MTFKEYVAQDLAVFVELSEFGEMIELDGVVMQAVVIRTTAESKYAPTAIKGIHPQKHGFNLIGDYITIYFKTSNYTRKRERIPQNTEIIHMCGKRYRVESSLEEMGITTLICSSDRQNTLTPQMVRARHD